MDRAEEIANFIKFSEEVGNLKDVQRRGWVLKNVPNPESVADHMYRMAMLTLALGPVENCDMGKVMRMCLVHDLAECRVGDITPEDNVPVDEKHRREREAMAALTDYLSPDVGKDLLDLYLEYEKHESPEAKLTKDLDLFDFVHQAFAYEKKAAESGAPVSSLNLGGFYREVDRIRHPLVKRLADHVIDERSKLLKKSPEPEQK